MRKILLIAVVACFALSIPNPAFAGWLPPLASETSETSETSGPPSPAPVVTQDSTPASGRVTAPSGLIMRAEPNRTAAKIIRLPTGTTVEIISQNGPEETIEGSKNRWFNIRAEGQEGWAFGSFIGTSGGSPSKRNDAGLSEFDAMITREMPGYAMAQPDQYAPFLAKDQHLNQPLTTSKFAVDLNGDGKVDVVTLLVNPTKKNCQVVLFMSRDEGWEPKILFPGSEAMAKAPPVQIAMVLKKPGEGGVSDRKYFTADDNPKLEGPALDKLGNEYKNGLAVELLLGGPDAGFDYSVQGWWFKNGKLVSLSASD